MTTINDDVAKRGIFIQEFRAVVEGKSIFADVATKLISTAKNISSPYTSVTVAKAHALAGQVPIGTLTVGVDELVLDRKIGNAITDYEEELSYAKFDVIGMIRGDLYASVIKKMNVQAVEDFVADATVVAGTVDLSTAAAVRNFLVTVAANAEAVAVSLAQKVDGATVKRGKYHGKPFVACGQTAFVAIVSQVAGIMDGSSLKAVEGGIIMTPYGVLVINLGAAADDAKRLIYGTGGALSMAYREDQIEVGMGNMVTKTTAAATSLDVTLGDDMLDDTWYMYAQTKGKNGIFTDVASLVSTQLAA